MSETIRVLTLDGQWEVLGAGRMRGLTAEGTEATANSWGPDQLSFQIKSIGPPTSRSDLSPYTPLTYEVDGLQVWSGRIKERPAGMHDHTVHAEGWQYHLDDDLLQRVYVHTRLGDYRDQRTFLTSQLANFHVAGKVANDDGVIVLGWANGDVVNVSNGVGVTLDLGRDSVGKRIVIEWESTNNDANTTFFARTGSLENPLAGSVDDAFTFTLASGASGTTAGTFATARRYIHLFLWRPSVGGTFGADTHLKIKSVKVFRDTAYESGNVSILKADAIIKDVRAFAPLLDQDNTLITAGTFNIPEAFTQGFQPPRELMEAVNAYENWRLKIGGQNLKAILFGPRPTFPLFEVGSWSGAQFVDQSASGIDIFDKVNVDATGPDGANLQVTRTQTGTAVDRRGFSRSRVINVNAAVTQSVAERFGDLWLTEHRNAPFSGKLSAKDGGIRRMENGASVPAHEMLLHTQEMVMFSNLANPDTGAWGRAGRIVGVSYKHADRAVEVDIDDRRDHFESLLARYALLAGMVR